VRLFLNDYNVIANGYSTQSRLDTLQKAGLPVWSTELDVQAADENTRADYYELALQALYSHPAVEGIVFWGFWDQLHWRGDLAAMAKGDNLELTAAGTRVLDLLNNQWMTDMELLLTESGDQFTVRGFHGDYEVRGYYKDREVMTPVMMTLGKKAMDLNLNMNFLPGISL